MSKQLGSILEHMEVLRRAEVAGVPPLAGVSEHTAPLREDRPLPDPLHIEPQAFAPAWVEPFFVVPRLAALDADAPAGGAEPEVQSR